MSYCGHWEAFGQFRSFLLHEVLKERLASGVVWEGEVKLLLGEGLYKLLVHLPGLVGRSDHSNSVLFLEDLLLVLGEGFAKLCEVRTSSATCSFFLLFLSFENLFCLIEVNDCWGESLGDIEGHSKHLIEFLFVINFGLEGQRRELEDDSIALAGQGADDEGLTRTMGSKEEEIV